MAERFTITLLGGFAVHRDSRPLDLPPSCQRIVALAALNRRPLPRASICTTLWHSASRDRATANLRTTLWRLRPLGADPLLTVTPQEISLAPGVGVDWRDAVDLIGRLLSRADNAPDADLVAELLPLLRTGALLDGWHDEWHAQARNTYHALRMSVLDYLVRVGCNAQEG